MIFSGFVSTMIQLAFSTGKFLNRLEFWNIVKLESQKENLIFCLYRCLGDPTTFGNLKPPKEVIEAVQQSLVSQLYNGYAPSTGIDSVQSFFHKIKLFFFFFLSSNSNITLNLSINYMIFFKQTRFLNFRSSVCKGSCSRI